MVASKVDSNPDLKTKILAETIVPESGTYPVLLTKVEINGGETFSPVFFRKLLSPLIDDGDYTLAQLTSNISKSHRKLLQTGVFSDLSVTVQPDFYSGLPDVVDYNKEKSLPTKVIFDLSTIDLNLSEGWFNFNNEEYMNLRLNYLNNNFNGNAEMVKFDVDYNPYKPYDHLISNAKFLANLNNPAYKFLVDLTHLHQNNQSWQGAKESGAGGIMGLVHSGDNAWDVFTGVALMKRTITAAEELEDFETPQATVPQGEYLKTALISNLSYNKLAYVNELTKNFPSGGYTWSLSNEIASYQGNSSAFLKSAFSYSFFKSFFKNFVTTQLSADVGGIFSHDGTSIHHSDKFYLGGYDTFPGFAKNAVDTNGGTQFYKLQATTYTKLPHWLHPVPASFDANPLRLYATGLVGNVTDSNILDDERGAVSAGVGLRYFNNWARFDMGYYVSSRVGSDLGGVKDGLKFSLSIGGLST
ncbi:uncharacterized protein SPAPADRAFT_61114 [Spathaspora passalidarum NRRL Y-27907]|uniref:Bacterial surface antigen (D15) domain-containing protein n=1 Tax=Spathaspora passalidarum (strain NRRL Y-27907 / 11-Y1) TaxID=619300 RepID=G3ANS6_SPAPN|nr:uncharacterized protein SPAPADRAFT_61114 [Spathaspora passalidarum NRRL Y-27907]EGW32011.1 hypothetical protein SPAPADRAFT_61114 [Spathaspora passalidarum NRRL Y-27907]